LKTSIEHRVIKNNHDFKTIIVTGKHNSNKLKSYEKKGVKFILLNGYRFNLKKIIKEVGKLNIDSILIEGGAKTISRAFKENIIDDAEFFIAPKILGDKKAVPFIEGFSPSRIAQAIQLKFIESKKYGGDISIKYEVR
jgi:diaminohydroxyphosphoribosylaminopyrimidine deaminase/5-amino-6-(5-phosphoribosylamino)uracil reductase